MEMEDKLIMKMLRHVLRDFELYMQCEDTNDFRRGMKHMLNVLLLDEGYVVNEYPGVPGTYYLEFVNSEKKVNIKYEILLISNPSYKRI